jgi:hypothetical protein
MIQFVFHLSIGAGDDFQAFNQRSHGGALYEQSEQHDSESHGQ